MSEKTVEEKIQEKGLTAPRIAPDDIDKKIDKISYHRLNGTLTICVVTLQNGFTVTGESACASPENFNEELDQNIARINAKEKIRALEGYLLKEKLYQEKNNERT
jgi:hypothetical protein